MKFNYFTTFGGVLVLSFYFNSSILKSASLRDSLYFKCMKMSSDTERIKCLDYKAFELSHTQPEVGLSLAKIALDMAYKANWHKGVALACNEIAVNYNTLSEFDSAILYYNKALYKFKQIKDLQAQSGVLSNLSIVLKNTGNYLGAIKVSTEALEIQDKLKNYPTKAIILENIGAIYLDLKDFNKSKAYYLKARKIYAQQNDSIGIARNMTNFAIILDKFGAYDSAIVTLLEALKINKNLNRIHSVQIVYANLGISYFHKKDFTSALYYQNEAIRYSKLIDSRHALAIDYGNIGETHLELYKSSGSVADLKHAVSYLRNGYELCAVLNFTPPQIEFSEKLVEALILEGTDYELAYKVLRRGHELKDSIYSKDNSIKIAKLEANKEVLKKDAELRLAKLENDLAKSKEKRQGNARVILILIIALLIVVLAFIYNVYTTRYRKHKLSMREISQFQSHQLRSPVVKIISIVDDLLLGDTLTETESKQLLGMLKSSAEELDERIHTVVYRASKNM
ncbi:MAG: tetratricopeptide repeat protein [Bacteroidota bacterium]